MTLTTRALATAAALSLVLGACGDDDDDAPAASGDPVEDVADEAADAAEDAADEAEDAADEATGDVSVEFTGIEDGAEVASPVAIGMAATGIEIEPAGEVREGAGHFHIMVDVGCVTPGEVIPGDTEGYNHFGKAQTDVELELEPGEHTLCLQVGDGAHTALDATQEITITVTE